jgi:hypothetical protein
VSWPRNPATCASAHAPVHGERGEDITDKAGPRRRERERKGALGATARRLAIRARETERESERAKETGADRSAPLGSEREREGAREGELPLTGGVRLSGGAGARPGWAELGRLGCFLLFFFSGFSNSFSISFSIGFFKSKFKLGFKFK